MAQQNQSTDSQQSPQQGAPDLSDVDQLGYEQAREQLVQIVSQLETGGASLEESLRLWERGEALADHCTRWLDGAQSRIEEAVARRENRSERA